MAIINDQLTAIGGHRGQAATNTLLSLSTLSLKGKWEQVLPPMPTARVRPATVSTPTHLMVAGGRTGFYGEALNAVDIFELDTSQWYSACGSPKAFEYPHMTLCGGYLYLSEDNVILSCPEEKLIKSCEPATAQSIDGASVWTKQANIPVPHHASLTTLRGQVLAIGGSDKSNSGTPTGAIHCYSKSTNSWHVIGKIPTARYNALVAVLPSDELMVDGGWQLTNKKLTKCDVTEIAHSH